jgi:hypothetical protein
MFAPGGGHWAGLPLNFLVNFQVAKLSPAS